MEQRAPGDLLAMLLARSLPAYFSISPHINFWLVSLFGAVFMMINMRFKDKGHQCVAADAGGVKKEDFIAVFKDRNFWVFVIFIVGTWSFYNIFDQQLFPVFYAGLFESHDVGTRLYGYLNSFQVVLEALCMAIIPFFVNRVGPKNALLIGVCDYGVAYPFLRVVR